MKKLLAILLAAVLLTASAAAEGYTLIDGKTDRGITIIPAEDHTPAPGISPTTGLPLDRFGTLPEGWLGLAVDGKYMPMAVQIDNSNGGIGMHWGLQYADVIYEAPLARNGSTRLTAVFADVLPTSVGPIRSARVGHVRIAAEWMGGFVHYGGPEVQGNDINAEMRSKDIQIIRQKNRFDGTDGTTKPWKKHFSVRTDRRSPHDKAADLAALSLLVSPEVEQVNHTFLFSDTLPTGGDAATDIRLVIGTSAMFNSHIVYDAQTNQYQRFMVDKQGGEYLYADSDSGEAITFSNVIVQYTTMRWNNGSSEQPLMTTLGGGNADLFIGGRHITGCWQHDVYHLRTVFYDAEGHEIALQPGRTLISVMDKEREVSYK